MDMKAKRILAGLGVALASLVASPAAFAVDVYVIANSALTLTADEVKDVFLGEKQVAGGTKVVPVDNSALQKDFLEKVVKLDAAKYGAVWTKKGFRDGLTAPAVKNSDAEVIAAVKANPGGVGYVSSAAAGVKVIQKF
jgi:ABC-type phosphate transport system substrate-binding protein